MSKDIPILFAVILIIGLFVFLFLWQFQSNLSSQSPIQSVSPTKMKIASPTITDKGAIPRQYTCDGANFNPPLTIHGISKSAKSLALIMDDPDSPSGTWSHWIAWNIDPTTTNIPENNSTVSMAQGTNDFSLSGYGGPCPNAGEHRYSFKLFALNSTLNLAIGATKEELEQAIKGHIIGQAELVGTYRRRK